MIYMQAIAANRNIIPNKPVKCIVDENRCIGCGFYAGLFPWEGWNMVENV